MQSFLVLQGGSSCRKYNMEKLHENLLDLEDTFFSYIQIYITSFFLRQVLTVISLSLVSLEIHYLMLVFLNNKGIVQVFE